MKTKSKLVLALAVLTAGTAFAGASGTFAWFTVNRSAVLTYKSVTAQATGPNLAASFLAPVANVTSTYSGATTQKATAAASYTTDISSGDGVAMAKPNWVSSAGGDNTDIAGVSQVYDASKFFTRFIIKVDNTAEAGQGNLMLFLDTTCAITASDGAGVDGQPAKNAALAKWTRVGVVYLGTSAPGAATSWATSTWAANGGIKPIIFENADTGSVKDQYVRVAPAANKLDYEDLPSGTTHTTDVATAFAVGASSNDTSANYVGTVNAASSVYLGVTVWLEGTEAVTQDTAIGGAVDITIGLKSIGVDA